MDLARRLCRCERMAVVVGDQGDRAGVGFYGASVKTGRSARPQSTQFPAVHVPYLETVIRVRNYRWRAAHQPGNRWRGIFRAECLARIIDRAGHGATDPVAVSRSPATGTGDRIRLSVTTCASDQPGACAWHRQCAPHGAAVMPTTRQLRVRETAVVASSAIRIAP